MSPLSLLTGDIDSSCTFVQDSPPDMDPADLPPSITAARRDPSRRVEPCLGVFPFSSFFPPSLGLLPKNLAPDVEPVLRLTIHKVKRNHPAASTVQRRWKGGGPRRSLNGEETGILVS